MTFPSNKTEFCYECIGTRIRATQNEYEIDKCFKCNGEGYYIKKYNLELSEDELIILWKYIHSYLKDNDEYNKFNEVKDKIRKLMESL